MRAMLAEDAGTPLASREPNRQRLTRRIGKQTPLRLSTSTVCAAVTSPAVLTGVPAKRGWLDVRASDRLGDGRFYCVLPVGASRLECYRSEVESQMVRVIELSKCGCIHAEDVADRSDFHWCLGTTEGSVLFWSSLVDGPSWVSALQTALHNTPTYNQSPPPPSLVDVSSPNRVAAPPTPVRSSPCVAPTAVCDNMHMLATNGTRCADGSRNDSATRPPEWLLDDEVRECPLCSNAFGFFLRRHHCRYAKAQAYSHISTRCFLH